MTTETPSTSELVAPHMLTNDVDPAVAAARHARVTHRWAREREQLHARTTWDPERIDAWQLERVRFVVEHAFSSHPFYHRVFREAGFNSGDLVDWDAYAALPAIAKSDIIENLDEFTWNRALPTTDVFRSHTSGSTGQVLQILQDSATSDAGQLFYLRHYEQMLRRAREPEEWLYEIYLAPQRYPGAPGAYPVFTLSQNCPAEAAFAHIAELAPTVLWTFPSFAIRMAREIDDLARLGIKAVCVHSESSTSTERAFLSERFGATVHDEYSSEELYLIATQCRDGQYHVVQDNVRVDVLAPDAQGRGEIVATSLVNSYMPFIRYRQGDVVRFDEHGSDCACGNRFVALGGFHGRADQDLLRPDGSVVPSDRVMGLYDETLLAHDSGVAEFRIAQNVDGGVDVFVRMDASADEPTMQGYMASFGEALGRMMQLPEGAVRQHVVTHMPATASHKRRLITSECNSPFDPRYERSNDGN